jgi:hypothetical protein
MHLVSTVLTEKFLGRPEVMSTLAVVEEILRETAIPLSVREIVEHAGARLPSKSKTPDTVVARDLSMDIKRKGDTSLFIRTSPGRYTLRALVSQPQPSSNEVTPLRPVGVSPQPMSALATRKPAAAASPARPAGRGDTAEGGGYVG